MQFWIGLGDLFGLDFDNPISGSGHRIIYYEEIDDTVTLDEVKDKYNIIVDDDYYCPIYKDPFKDRAIEFCRTKQAVSSSCYLGDKIIVEQYNKFFPEDKIEDIFDMDDDVGEYIWEYLEASGSRIGGYPYFTQDDPRDEGTEYTELLLQIDSDDEFDLMWGDVGVGNFFVTSEQLKNKDFTKVLYNWDCC